MDGATRRLFAVMQHDRTLRAVVVPGLCGRLLVRPAENVEYESVSKTREWEVVEYFMRTNVNQWMSISRCHRDNVNPDSMIGFLAMVQTIFAMPGRWKNRCRATYVALPTNCSTRFAREVGIINPNSNPKTLTLILTLTQEINKHLCTRSRISRTCNSTVASYLALQVISYYTGKN